MKLSVSAFRAQATAQRKILKPYQNQLNYGACSSFSTSGIKVDEGSHMMVDKTGISSPRRRKSGEPSQRSENSGSSSQEEERMSDHRPEPEEDREDVAAPDKSLGVSRTKSNQRWMKLRTTVQLSGAISNTIQKSKPPLKREDSFLKRFSTRQIPEAQETVDTGDETEQANGTRTQEEVNRRRRKRRKEQSRTVVNPDENFYFYWLMTVTVCVLYNLWTLIVRQSFPELQRDSSAFWYACDGFTDVVFVCDIAVQFRTGYLEQGLMVYDSRKLAKHYLKSKAFAFDLISLIPLDLLQMEIGTNPILRFPRFLKIYRVYNYYYIVESRTVYPNLWRVINLIHILLILAHWFGCFYYLLSEAEGFQGAWVYPFRQGDDATLTRKYLGSLYWSTLTLTTIGDLPTPETNAEYIFTIVSYLIGVFIFATIVGQVGNVITNRNANRLEFERLLDGAKTYMRHHKVPGGMKRRVLRWYDYSWSRGRIQGGGDINTALGLLPDKLKTELALHVNLSVLKKVTIFQECQPEFLHDLVLKMKAYIFTPGDLICRKGEIAREMFIIADGILDVISDTGRVLTTMKAGDFFGEIGILNLDGLNKRTADVRSVGYSELFSLSREDVLTAMKDYPEAQEILQSLGRKRLMEARNASKIHKIQVKPIKEHESLGESENAGKRIVEKLRSDVKGLKNALRRSRRESRDEDDCDNCRDGHAGKPQVKKHLILRRMSHVQSSDECESSEATPIGAGLPLLQRMKLLKEKQDREKEEKNRTSNTLSKGEDGGGTEAALRPAPMSVSLEENEGLAEVTSGELMPFSRQSTSSPENQKESSVAADRVQANSANHEIFPHRGSEWLLSICAAGTGSPQIQTASNEGSREEESRSQCAQQLEMPITPTAFDREFGSQETSIHVPKTKGYIVNSVPKQSLGSNLEVPKNKEKWNIMKRLTGSQKTGQETVAKSRECYLSKSDTILEKQTSVEMTMGKRSRSMSPSDESKNRRRTLKSAVEHIIRERRRSRSLSRADIKYCNGNPRPSGYPMKKYDSIDDLSPQYSGLPFVKKLKILNERQKLAELVEKELVVRSASLEIPERATDDESLTRSLSVACTIDLQGDRGRPPRKTTWETDCKTQFFKPRPFRPEDCFRAAMLDMKQRLVGAGSSGSLQSPESNETVERRHLKSILKKLSADEDAGDGDRLTKSGRRAISLRRRGPIDLKRLMRAPTVEGYVARHTKLTKSVTFDRETLQSPTEPAAAEGKHGDGPNPANQTATLTPQLFDSTAKQTANPNRARGDTERSEEMAILEKLEEDVEKFFEEGTTSMTDFPSDKLVYGLRKILENHLNAARCKLRLQQEGFEAELRKREEVISRLRTKVKELQKTEYEREMTSISTGVENRMGCSVSSNSDAKHSREDYKDSSFRTLDAPLRISESDENESAGSPESMFGVVHESLRSRVGYGSYEKKGFEDIEMAEIGEDLLSVGKTRSNRPTRNAVSEEQKTAEEERNRKSPKAKLINRVADFRRSISKSNDFVTVGIESSESSDPEEIGINDWEIRMLAEELSKMEEDEDQESQLQQLEEMKKLEEDVKALKRVVCEGTLSRFSASELDMLETILEAKDQRISEMASSSCFDIAGRELAKPNSRPRGRYRCRRKIGQAASFDFHDMDDGMQRTHRKRDSRTDPHGERVSLDDLSRAFGLPRTFDETAASAYFSDDINQGSHPKEIRDDVRSGTASVPPPDCAACRSPGKVSDGDFADSVRRKALCAEANSFRDQVPNISRPPHQDDLQRPDP